MGKRLIKLEIRKYITVCSLISVKYQNMQVATKVGLRKGRLYILIFEK